MTKTRVAILRGGLSDEYSVSLQTGASVLEAMDRTRFEPFDVLVTKTGEWFVNGIRKSPEQILPVLDVVFIALHGTYGEDGTVQRLLDRYNVPYTGSRAYASRIAMHKALTKEHIKELPVKLARHMVVSQKSAQSIPAIAQSINSLFGPQYFIKPTTSGSSVGTKLVKNPLLLATALDEVLQLYPEVIVEERIHGREATCGVIERYRGQALYALPPIEIVPPAQSDFFAADVKYTGTTEEICPSRFSHEVKAQLEHISKQVHKTLNLAQYSRSDFIVAEDGIYFLEVNTLPGLTKESLLPKAISAVGGTYADFVTHLLTDAMSTCR